MSRAASQKKGNDHPDLNPQAVGLINRERIQPDGTVQSEKTYFISTVARRQPSVGMQSIAEIIGLWRMLSTTRWMQLVPKTETVFGKAMGQQ